MQNKLSIYLILLSLTMLSCNKWLEVKPTDRVTEDNTFSTPQTFKRALNGVYIELNDESIYGRALSCDLIDIIAQYYFVNDESINNKELTQYRYTSSGNVLKFERIWGKMYNTIANTNLIIRNSDNRRDILSDDYYALIKGEALALRALLHFDLFRLFGPVYEKGNVDARLPYYTDYVLDANPALPSDDFLTQVIADLKEALVLLEKDPIITFGPMGDPSDDFKKFRTLRLNYYAVKGLLARVYLYAKENELALETAKEVMAVQEQWFPWIKPEQAQSNQVFSTELLFSLQNTRRSMLFTSLFDSKNIQSTNLLATDEKVAMRMFDNQRHDYRFIANMQSTILIGSNRYTIFGKYAAPSDSLENQLIPMIRMSEMFYIAAEAEPSRDEGFQHINIVRNNRGLSVASYDYSDFPDFLLTTEYTREFWGEGQLFYFFKRRNARTIQDPTYEYGTISMQPNNYVIPIPEAETKFN